MYPCDWSEPRVDGLRKASPFHNPIGSLFPCTFSSSSTVSWPSYFMRHSRQMRDGWLAPGRGTQPSWWTASSKERVYSSGISPTISRVRSHSPHLSRTRPSIGSCLFLFACGGEDRGDVDGDVFELGDDGFDFRCGHAVFGQQALGSGVVAGGLEGQQFCRERADAFAHFDVVDGVG